MDPGSWMTREKASIDEKLLRHGAVLLRGLRVADDQFQDVVQVMCGDALEHVYRSTPRTAIGKNVHTTTANFLLRLRQRSGDRNERISIGTRGRRRDSSP